MHAGGEALNGWLARRKVCAAAHTKCILQKIRYTEYSVFSAHTAPHRLAGAGLAVGEDSTVETIEDEVDDRHRRLLVYHVLWSRAASRARYVWLPRDRRTQDPPFFHVRASFEVREWRMHAATIIPAGSCATISTRRRLLRDLATPD